MNARESLPRRWPRRTPAARNSPQPTQDAAPRTPAARSPPQTTNDAARSAGGTRGAALVLSDIRTASIGCAPSPAQCPPRFTSPHAASHRIAHSTLHRKSRSPRQRARGLRPSCHPALRAGVLGGDGSAARGGRQPARSARQRRAPAAQRAAIHSRQPRNQSRKHFCTVIYGHDY